MKNLIKSKNMNYYLCIIIFAALSLGLFVDNKYILDILITTIYFSVIASAWNLMCGYSGQTSIGHAAFIGLGQYTSSILFVRLGLSPWIGMILGSFVAILLALFIGILSLKLKHFFFSLSTIALCTILQVLVVKFNSLTGGSVGISIPYKPSFWNMIFKEYKPYYFLFICLLFLVLLATSYVSKSRLGSNLIAIREDETAASSLGVNILSNKIIAFCISAFFTSIAGTLYAQYTLFIEPIGAFNIGTSLKPVMLSFIGGVGTVFGPLVGGLILGPLEIFLRGALGSSFQGAYLVIYGLLLILVVLIMPNGILGSIANAFYKKKKS